jgi:hypothetical protein
MLGNHLLDGILGGMYHTHKFNTETYLHIIKNEVTGILCQLPDSFQASISIYSISIKIEKK